MIKIRKSNEPGDAATVSDADLLVLSANKPSDFLLFDLN
jgi:hypothetical protein